MKSFFSPSHQLSGRRRDRGRARKGRAAPGRIRAGAAASRYPPTAPRALPPLPPPRLLPLLGRTHQVVVLWKATAAIFSQPLTHGLLLPTTEGTGLPSCSRKGTCFTPQSAPRGSWLHSHNAAPRKAALTMAVCVREPGQQPPTALSTGHVTEPTCRALVVRRSPLNSLPHHKFLA